MRIPDPKAVTAEEAYLGYKAEIIEESELKPSLYEPYLHFDGWLAYWCGLTNTYPIDENENPEMLCDEEALVAYLSGVTDTYPEEIKDPYDVRITGYLRYLCSYRFGRPEYPVTNSEFYLSLLDAPHTSNETPSADIELDTSEGKLIDVKAYGDTYQQTYSGKNMWNNAQVESVSDYVLPTATGLRLYKTANGRITPQYSISLSANTTYTISCVSTHTTQNSLLLCQWKTEDNQTLWSPNIDNGTTAFTPNKNIVGVVFYVQATEDDGTYVEVDNLMIEAGSTATAYEPYTGGIPAPNPDYPQPIQVVTGEQTVNVHGKNLLNPTLFDGITQNSDGTLKTTKYYTVTTAVSFHLKASTRYTLSIRNSDGELDGQGWGVAVNGTWINTTSGVGAVNTDASGEVSLQIGASSYGAIGNWNSFIQLEQGNQPTTYEPYQGATYNVDLGNIELCKIHTYQDYIYKSGNDWYVHKALNKIVLNGTESGWFKNYAPSHPTGYSITASDLGIPKGRRIMSTHWIYSSTTWNGIPYFGVTVSGTLWLQNIEDMQLDVFKAWLASNNPAVYHILATPTDTKITDSALISQLEALAGADTYNKKTFIKVTANEPNLPALLKVEAYKY